MACLNVDYFTLQCTRAGRETLTWGQIVKNTHQFIVEINKMKHNDPLMQMRDTSLRVRETQKVSGDISFCG